MSPVLCFLAFILCILPKSYEAKHVVCYYGSWAVYRPGDGKFGVENIDPLLCTHIIYSFAGLDPSNRIVALDAYNDLEDNWGKGGYKRLNNLKKVNPSLKTLIAIGGWNEGSVKYSNMVANPASRRTFVTSVVAFLKKHNFDGLDLDWEYPANRGGSPQDKRNFGILVKELREEFDKNGWLLTAAVGAGKAVVDSAYDVPTLSKYLHFINVMTYDFHGSWERSTGVNAPLFSRSGESFQDQMLNVNYSIRHWMSSGAPANKLVLGIGLYGRSFTLANAQVHGVGAPAIGPGTAGVYTREAGMLGYNEICDNIINKGWNVVQNTHQSPYAYSGNQWVGFDDESSVRAKCDFANSLGLAGGMVWSIETDDFHGKCRGIKFPLIRVIRNAMTGTDSKPNPKPNPKPTPTPPKKPNVDEKPVAPPGSRIQCTKASFLRHPADCSRFVRCVPTNVPGSFSLVEYSCQSGLVFDNKIQACNWPQFVPECH